MNSISLNESNRTLQTLGTQFADLSRELRAALERHYAAHGSVDKMWVAELSYHRQYLDMVLKRVHPDRPALEALEADDASVVMMLAESHC